MSPYKFLDITASVPPTDAVDESLPMDNFPPLFEDAILKFAENILARRGSDVALKVNSEENLGTPREVSWDQLEEEVRALEDAFQSSVLRKEDAVAVIGSNTIAPLALLLATAAVGDIFSSFATHEGERALSDRLGRLRPRIVLTESAYTYNGNQHDNVEKVMNVFSGIEKPPGAEPVICTNKITRRGWTSLEEFRGMGLVEGCRWSKFHSKLPSGDVFTRHNGYSEGDRKDVG